MSFQTHSFVLAHIFCPSDVCLWSYSCYVEITSPSAWPVITFWICPMGLICLCVSDQTEYHGNNYLRNPLGISLLRVIPCIPFFVKIEEGTNKASLWHTSIGNVKQLFKIIHFNIRTKEKLSVASSLTECI